MPSATTAVLLVHSMFGRGWLTLTLLALPVRHTTKENSEGSPLVPPGPPFGRERLACRFERERA
jgi:hypothetical protein